MKTKIENKIKNMAKSDKEEVRNIISNIYKESDKKIIVDDIFYKKGKDVNIAIFKSALEILNKYFDIIEDIYEYENLDGEIERNAILFLNDNETDEEYEIIRSINTKDEIKNMDWNIATLSIGFMLSIHK